MVADEELGQQIWVEVDNEVMCRRIWYGALSLEKRGIGDFFLLLRSGLRPLDVGISKDRSNVLMSLCQDCHTCHPS
jgi:hypothetical protein